MMEITKSEKVPWEGPTPISSVAALSEGSQEDTLHEMSICRNRQLRAVLGASLKIPERNEHVDAYLRSRFLEPQGAAVDKGRGSVTGLVLMMMQCGQYSAALDRLEAALGSVDDSYWWKHLHSLCLWELGKRSQAEDGFQRLIASCPNDPRPKHALGRLLGLVGRFEDSLPLLRAAAALSDEAAVGSDLGAVLIAANQPRESLRVLRDVLREVPLYTLAWVNSGVAHYQLRNKKKAIDSFRRAVAIDPTSSVAICNLGEIYCEAEKWTEAAQVLQQHVQRKPSDIMAAMLLAWAHLSTDRLHDAKAVLETAKSTSPVNGSLRGNLAIVYAALGDHGRARACFEKAIELAPNSATLRANFANFLRRERDWQRLIQVLREKDIDDVPDRAILLSEALLEVGDFERTALVLRRACEKFGDARFVVRLLYVLTSYLHRFDEAVQVGQKGLQEFPNHLMIANNLAYSLISSGQLKEAQAIVLPAYQRGVSERNEVSACLSATLGLLKIREGKWEEGHELYRRAYMEATGRLKRRIKQKMTLEEGRRHLECGASDKARRLLQEVISGPDGEFSNEARRLLGSRGLRN